MARIALIMPYFGQWPPWADLFFHSCAANREVDFHFFTDCPTPAAYSGVANIHFHPASFAEYCRHASQRLGIDFHPDKAYKLCDLKPFYGLLHEEMLLSGGYDFFGWADVDVVWGDIRRFYTDTLLEDYDILSTHADRVSGHLALVRNTEHYRSLCLRIPQWRELLQDPRNHALDEQHFTLLVHPRAKWLWKAHRHIFFRLPFRDEWRSYGRFVRLFNRAARVARHRLYLKEQETSPYLASKHARPVSYRYVGDRVYDTGNHTELIYLHFLFLKRFWGADSVSPLGGRTDITIDNDGIRPTPGACAAGEP